MISKALSLYYLSMIMPLVQEMNGMSSRGLLWLGMRFGTELIVKNINMLLCYRKEFVA